MTSAMPSKLHEKPRRQSAPVIKTLTVENKLTINFWINLFLWNLNDYIYGVSQRRPYFELVA